MRCTASVICGMSLAFTVMTFTPTRAETYPSRAVRIIVPYGPGGIADVTMRLVAQDLSKRFGQQFFIENRPGAGGVVGMQAAREAPADGYTLVMVGGGLTIAKALFKSLPYNIEADFTPISTTASYGLDITTKTGSPYKTIRDVIANAKAKLKRKGCDWIVANDVSPASGVMGGDRNTIHLLARDDAKITVDSWPVMGKEQVATALVARIASTVLAKTPENPS